MFIFNTPGLPHKEIARLTDLSVNTITSYMKRYQQKGLDGIFEINFYQPKSDLVEYTTTIQEYFEKIILLQSMKR